VLKPQLPAENFWSNYNLVKQFQGTILLPVAKWYFCKEWGTKA